MPVLSRRVHYGWNDTALAANARGADLCSRCRRGPAGPSLGAERSVLQRRAAADNAGPAGKDAWARVPAPVQRLSEEIVVLMRFGLKAAEVAYEAEAFAAQLDYEPLSAPPGLEIDDLVRKAANSILGKAHSLQRLEADAGAPVVAPGAAGSG